MSGDDSDLGTFQPRDPAPHLASKNLEEHGLKRLDTRHKRHNKRHNTRH